MTEKIFSKKYPEKLLHIIHRLNGHSFALLNQRVDLCDPGEYLQVAFLNYEGGKEFQPHRHIIKDSPAMSYTQETWIVMRGRVQVDYYDVEGNEIIHSTELCEGDCTVTLYGGHSYKIMEGWGPHTIVYEVKSGPYKGKDIDKTMI